MGEVKQIKKGRGHTNIQGKQVSFLSGKREKACHQTLLFFILFFPVPCQTSFVISPIDLGSFQFREVNKVGRAETETAFSYYQQCDAPVVHNLFLYLIADQLAAAIYVLVLETLIKTVP